MSASTKPSAKPLAKRRSPALANSDASKGILFDLFVEEYRIADEFAREVEHFNEEAYIPAMNELRYAGFHLLAAVRDGGLGQLKESELTKAINHCKRASYEAAEAGIVEALDRITDFRDDYQNVVISEVVTGWQDILLDAQQAINAMRRSRTHGDDRSPDYKAHRELFALLKGHSQRLDAARDDMNAKVVKERREGRRFLTTISLTGLGIVVAIVIGLLTLA